MNDATAANVPNEAPSPLENELQRLLNERMQIARDLADVARDVQYKRDELAAAEKSYRAQYDLALSNGWSSLDLKKVGLPNPAPKPRTRTRRKPKGDSTTNSGS